MVPVILPSTRSRVTDTQTISDFPYSCVKITERGECMVIRRYR